MHDWERLVHRELTGMALNDAERDEVTSELAAHLEESFEALRKQGLPEELAATRALAQVQDWRKLQRRIEMARSREELMTDRVKQWWLPGFVGLFVSMVLLMANELISIKFSGTKPLIVSAHSAPLTPPVAVIYVPWLLLLIPVGALGAYLARRAGGSQRAIFLSIAFPVLPHLAFFILVFPVVLALDGHVAHNIMLSALFMALIAWVLLPGIALLAGGLPMRFLQSRRAVSGRITNA